jgi:lipid A disaccharide synthetase
MLISVKMKSPRAGVMHLITAADRKMGGTRQLEMRVSDINLFEGGTASIERGLKRTPGVVAVKMWPELDEFVVIGSSLRLLRA